MSEMIEVLYGTAELEPIEYRLTSETIKGKWWRRDRVQFWIETNYGRIGPLDSEEDAISMAAQGGVRLTR